MNPGWFSSGFLYWIIIIPELIINQQGFWTLLLSHAPSPAPRHGLGAAQPRRRRPGRLGRRGAGGAGGRRAAGLARLVLAADGALQLLGKVGLQEMPWKTREKSMENWGKLAVCNGKIVEHWKRWKAWPFSSIIS